MTNNQTKTIFIQGISMLKQTLSFVASATLVASLGANTLQLEPIVVSASKTEQSLKGVTANVDVITAEELEERHITSVLDALRIFTSIPIAQSGGMGQQSSFYQRGFKTENTVVMIDGIRYNDPTTIGGAAQLEHLMVNDIERIEIINGPQSGVWGANAVAGVINIITKKASKNLSIEGNIEYGSYATTKVGANVSQKIGSLSYYLGVNQIKTDGISAITPYGKNSRDYETDSYKNQTVNTKLAYDITPSDVLTTQFTFINAKTQYDGDSGFPFYTPLPNSTGYEIHQMNRLGNVGYRHNFDHGDYLDATYSVTTFNKEDPLGWTTQFKGSNKELNLLGKVHYNENGFVVIGANNLNSRDIINAKELDSKGIFLTNTNQLDKLVLTESIRRDQYSVFNDKTTGKIGAKYFVMPDFSLSSNYGTAYRTPSLYELYDSWSGNPNLTPETTKGYDVTAQYKALTLTYFNNKIDNLIDYDFGSFSYANVPGQTTFEGYELGYKQNVLESFSLNLDYTKLFAKDKNGNYYAKRPHDSAKATIDYFGINKLLLNVAAQYVGTRYEGNNQTGRYTLVSALANYEFTRFVSIYLKGDNLTDKLYQEVFGYGTYGRTISVGLNAKF
jgi:vitamin B12 transporter